MPFTKGHKINVGRKVSEETRRKIGAGNKISVQKFYDNGGHAWNKGLKVRTNTGRTHFKKGCVNELNTNWKGNDVGYHGLHKWIQRHKGKADKCEKCGILNAKKYEWANISGEYKRDVDDFMSMCVSCHILFDTERRGFNRRRFPL